MNAPDNTQYIKVIEALLFASAEPLSASALQKHLPDEIKLQSVLEAIAERYGEESGIELRQVGNAWAFRTKAEVASFLALEETPERKLSRAALETLAIIAYHQPTTRAEIEEIRGVSIHSGTLDILLEQGWIKPMGHRQTPGRPLTWGTTTDFLDHFGLDDISALPGLSELKEAGLLRSGTSLSDGESSLGEILNEDFGTSSEEQEDEGERGEDAAL